MNFNGDPKVKDCLLFYTPDPWLVTTNLRKIEGAGPFCKSSCFLDCNGSKTCTPFFLSFASTKMSRSAHSKQYLATRLLSFIICTPYCYIIYTYARHYRYIRRVHSTFCISFATVNDVTKSARQICILVQKVITRNINYMSDRMRVTSMHYLCCLSFLSV